MYGAGAPSGNGACGTVIIDVEAGLEEQRWHQEEQNRVRVCALRTARSVFAQLPGFQYHTDMVFVKLAKAYLPGVNVGRQRPEHVASRSSERTKREHEHCAIERRHATVSRILARLAEPRGRDARAYPCREPVNACWG